MSPEKYIEVSNATPSMKARLREALSDFARLGITYDNGLPPEHRKKWLKTKAFVKTENNLYSGLMGEVEKAPRNISAKDEHYTIGTAPTVVGLQQQIKALWKPPFPLILSSGIEAQPLATWFDKQPGRLVEDDIDWFDRCLHETFLKLEAWMMKRLHAPKLCTDLMDQSIMVRGTTAHGISYGGVDQRQSGTGITYLGNSIWNGCMHLFIVVVDYDVSTHTALVIVVMILCGDDMIMKYIGVAINFKGYMRKFGFQAKAIHRISLEFAEYCSNRFYPVAEGWTMAPKPGRVIAKLGYFISPPTGVDPLALVRGSALGLWNACFAVPPLRAYLERLLQLTYGAEAYRNKFEEWKMQYTPCNATIDTWGALSLIYDWDQGRQKIFEQKLSMMKLGDELDNPLSYLLMDRDTQSKSWCYNKDAFWGSYGCEGRVYPRGYEWSISGKLRNKKAHTTTGNTMDNKGIKAEIRAAVKDEKKIGKEAKKEIKNIKKTRKRRFLLFQDCAHDRRCIAKSH